jgi:hypothetical protein
MTRLQPLPSEHFPDHQSSCHSTLSQSCEGQAVSEAVALTSKLHLHIHVTPLLTLHMGQQVPGALFAAVVT